MFGPIARVYSRSSFQIQPDISGYMSGYISGYQCEMPHWSYCRQRRRRGICFKPILKIDTFFQDFLKICQVQFSGMHSSRVFQDHIISISSGTQVTSKAGVNLYFEA